MIAIQSKKSYSALLKDASTFDMIKKIIIHMNDVGHNPSDVLDVLHSTVHDKLVKNLKMEQEYLELKEIVENVVTNRSRQRKLSKKERRRESARKATMAYRPPNPQPSQKNFYTHNNISNPYQGGSVSGK